MQPTIHPEEKPDIYRLHVQAYVPLYCGLPGSLSVTIVKKKGIYVDIVHSKKDIMSHPKLREHSQATADQWRREYWLF
jgi:hypothetical protein